MSSKPSTGASFSIESSASERAPFMNLDSDDSPTPLRRAISYRESEDVAIAFRIASDNLLCSSRVMLGVKLMRYLAAVK